MKELNLEPVFLMNMKLGEGSGAILMFPFIEAACNITKDVRLYPNVWKRNFKYLLCETWRDKVE